jgi:hypothetical protein
MDTRKDGLIWVIKALWMLDVDVHIEHMPSFLDNQSMNFLLNYAKQDLKRSELHKVLVDFKI